MGKRKGINSRKNYARRKNSVMTGIRRSMPVFVVIIAAIAIIGAAICGGVLSYGKLTAAVEHSGMFAVKSITVNGNERLSAADIVALAGVSQSAKLYRIQTATVASSLLAEPWIEKARCVKKWWGAVAIEITERTPIALVSAPEVRLVDHHGVLLPVEPGKTYDLPLIAAARFTTDRRGVRCVDSASIARVARFIARVRALPGEPLTGISQLDIRDSGSVFCRVASSAAVVEIGYDADDKQLRNLRYLLTALVEQPSAVARIDLRYANLAFVSEQAPAQSPPRGAVN